MQLVFPIQIIFDSGKPTLHAEIKLLNFLKHGYSQQPCIFPFMHLCLENVFTITHAIYPNIADLGAAEVEACIWGLSLAEVPQKARWSAAFQSPAFDQRGHYKPHAPGFAKKDKARRHRGKKTNVGCLPNRGSQQHRQDAAAWEWSKVSPVSRAALLASQDGFTQLRPGLPISFIRFTAR